MSFSPQHSHPVFIYRLQSCHNVESTHTAVKHTKMFFSMTVLIQHCDTDMYQYDTHTMYTSSNPLLLAEMTF